MENTNNRQRTKLRSLEDDVTEKEVSKKKRRYVPKRRSGAYAILLGLLENSSQRGGSSKNEIVALAHKYCDLTFHSNPTTRDFHSGWSAIKTLLSRALVVEEGRPKKYLLTEEGEEMAHILKRTDQITFQDEDGYQRKYNTTAKESTNCGLESEFDDSVNYSELMETVAYSKNSNSYSQVLDQKNLPSFSKARKIHSLGPSGSATATGPVPRNQSPLKGSEDGIVRARWNATSYELWNPDTYDIVLVIDHREVKSKREREFFADQLRERDVIVEVRSLSLSDMLWVARHKITKRECILNFMLERKRLDDFAMSIMDNRFVEQKNRLKKTGCRNIYYLVEDSTSDIAIRMADAIKTAVWVTVVYNNFYVKRTKNSDDTVSWLHSLTEVIKSHYCNTSLLVLSPRNLKSQDDYLLRLQEFRDQFERDASLIECCHTFDCFQEIMEKKSLMTVKELYLKTLMVNKGVSLEKAVSIQAKFPTLKVLLEASLQGLQNRGGS